MVQQVLEVVCLMGGDEQRAFIVHAAADDTLQGLARGDVQPCLLYTSGLEAFLDAVNIFDLDAKTEDRTDFSVAFWYPEAPLTGFNVRCCLTPMNPLLDGGRTANLKLEQSGVKFAVPTVNKVNALPESSTEVAERMMICLLYTSRARLEKVETLRFE